MRKSLNRMSILSCGLALLATGFFAGIQKASASQPMKEWTFLVYLNGNNNLDSYGAMNINQMESVGSTDQINIVVQWASQSRGSTQRLLVQKDNDINNVTSPVVQNMGKVDMGDYRNLVDFITWAAANYPAKHYFVDIWDHGSGWHAIQARRAGISIKPMDISFDETTGNAITTVQLGTALADASKAIGHKIDLYGSDACLMAMAEIADEMKDSVQYSVGSEETEPGEGWPYDSFLSAWAANPAMTTADVAKLMVQHYTKAYSGGGEYSAQSVTFSAFDLEKMGQFNTAMSALSQQVVQLDSGGSQKMVSLIAQALGFALPDYIDLMDFLSLAKDAKISPLGDDVFKNLSDAAQSLVIAAGGTGSTFDTRAKGLSFWLPSTKTEFSSHETAYQALKFDQDTHWGDALKNLLSGRSRTSQLF